MTKHPITPPVELAYQWRDETCSQDTIGAFDDVAFATRAARWGADQELEACIEWVYQTFTCGVQWSEDLRAARRPKSLSKKERALKALSQIENQFLSAELAAEIRCALEELPDD